MDRIDRDRTVSAVSSLACYPPFVHGSDGVRGKVSHGFACDKARNESSSAESVDFRSETVPRSKRIAIVDSAVSKRCEGSIRRSERSFPAKFRVSVIDIDKRPREKGTVYRPIKRHFNQPSCNVRGIQIVTIQLSREWFHTQREINVRSTINERSREFVSIVCKITTHDIGYARPFLGENVHRPCDF